MVTRLTLALKKVVGEDSDFDGDIFTNGSFTARPLSFQVSPRTLPDVSQAWRPHEHE